MFEKAKIFNSNGWKSKNQEFQCLEKLNPDFQYLEKPKSRFPMFGKAKIQNSDYWKSKNLEFQC